MPTLKDVAERAGVTVTTVSRMLNGHDCVSPATREKIRQAMREIGYFPNEMARALSKKHSNFIGLIVPSARNCFFADLIHYAEAAAQERGCKLLLCVSNQNLKKEHEYYQMLLSNKVMGVIMISFNRSLSVLSKGAAPFVVFEKPAVSGIPYAVTDDELGGRLAGEHMISRGARHLLYLSGSAGINDISRLRYDGLTQACRSAKLDDPIMVETSWDEFIDMNYDETIERIFQEYPEADGVFASNDIIAAGVLRYCRKKHIHVPRKLKIVGYDDTSFASLSPVQLTTIHQPIEEITRYAVDCLVRQAKGETIPVTTLFPVRLVARETT